MPFIRRDVLPHALRASPPRSRQFLEIRQHLPPKAANHTPVTVTTASSLMRREPVFAKENTLQTGGERSRSGGGRKQTILLWKKRLRPSRPRLCQVSPSDLVLFYRWNNRGGQRRGRRIRSRWAKSGCASELANSGGDLLSLLLASAFCRHERVCRRRLPGFDRTPRP